MPPLPHAVPPLPDLFYCPPHPPPYPAQYPPGPTITRPPPPASQAASEALDSLPGQLSSRLAAAAAPLGSSASASGGMGTGPPPFSLQERRGLSMDKHPSMHMAAQVGEGGSRG